VRSATRKQGSLSKESKDEADLWWLHIEKVETHSVDSLNAINLVFYDFADKHGIDPYDGMDVGPVAALDRTAGIGRNQSPKSSRVEWRLLARSSR